MVQYFMVIVGEARTKTARVWVRGHLSMHGALAFIEVWGVQICAEKKRSKGSTFGCLLGTFV